MPESTLTGPDLAAAAARLQPVLMRNSDVHEELNALSPEVVEALHEAGVFGMWVPRELGGAELGPRESIDLIASLTYADPASGWVVMAAALATGAGGAYASDVAVGEIFAGDRFPVIAGQATRFGKATVVDGGFRLTGDWSFGSGIKHAGWIHTAAEIPETGEARIFLLPVREEYLDDSSWDVMGLLGTGSVDYKLRDVFVPESHTYDMFSNAVRRGGSLYGIGRISFALLGHTGFAFGAGRRLLDELLRLVQAGKGRPGQIAEQGAFLEEYARQEAKLRGARAWVMEVWGEIEESLAAGATELTTRQETLIRLSLHDMTFTAYDVMNFVVKSAATQVIRPGVLQRYVRDMIVASTHATSSQPVLRDAGRELAGLAAGKHWAYLALADDRG